MIASCPKCTTRYRVDPERVGPDGLRLRCTRCQAVFRVRTPGGAAPPSAPAEQPQQDRRRLVLVADPNAERGKATAAALGRSGLETVVAHEGVEAILTLQRTGPRAVVLDAALPRMDASQICELVKRNESLRSTWVVRVGAPDDRPRSGDPYGPDASVERGELPTALLPLLRGFGLPVREPASETPGPAPRPLQAPAAAPSQAPGPSVPPAPVDDELAPERAKAERLARIIVSDIVLYNEQKFAAAVAGGDVLRSMAAELDEGRALLAGRIDEGVRGTRDFVADELLRVARSRGAS